jgi:hypothetical protein
VPIEPAERGPNHRALIQATLDDLLADRLRRPTQALARNRRLVVASASAQEVDTVDADTNLGMGAKVN